LPVLRRRSIKVLGPEHPDTATSLNNLALLFQGQAILQRHGRSAGPPIAKSAAFAGAPTPNNPGLFHAGL
jgi:hypothetical protein